ncbi:MAG: type III pantothenate kinase [Prolixibacteraceae bacterium]|nr:type III pantothenate kinase [Prolixibacteraceae bacterium]
MEKQMLLVIDIGNTNIVFGIIKGDQWIGNWRIQTDDRKTADEYEVIFRSLLWHGQANGHEVEAIILSSVVPNLVQPISDMLAKLFGQNPIIVGPDIYPKLPIKILNPYQIGSDLVVNSLAAYTTYGKFVTVIDFGTALTFTTIGAEAVIKGVAIAPGLNTAVDALAGKTAQLPRVHLKAPPSALGQNTIHAIQSGVVLGYAGLVESMIRCINSELECEVTVVATGGLCQIMAPIIPAIHHVEPLLTLNGLRLVKEYVK